MKYPLFKVFIAKDLSSLSIDFKDNYVFGPYQKEFKYKLEKYLKTENIIPISDFDHAIHIMIKSFNLKSGDSVILSPFCCRALILPFLNNNIDIIWADIDPSTGTIDPNSIMSRLKHNTKLILHNHLGGTAGHVKDIYTLCQEKGLFFAGDCSQSFLTKYENYPLGIRYYDAAIYSFHTVRIPSAIQGAGLFLKDNERFKKTIPLVDYGINRLSNYLLDNKNYLKNDLLNIGYGAVMSELNALIGLRNFEHLEKLFIKQTEIIKMIDGYVLNSKKFVSVDCKNNNFKWVYGLRSSSKNSDIEIFHQNNIEAKEVHTTTNPVDFKRFITGCKDFERELKGFNQFVSEYFAIPCGWWLYKNIDFKDLLEKIINEK